MRWVGVCFACLAAVGCDSSATAPAASTTVAPPTAPTVSKLSGFTATIEGKPLVLDSAVAFSRGGSALHITVSTHPLECDKIAGTGFRLEPGEALFDFTVAPVMKDEKTSVWMITGSRLGDVTRQGELGEVEVTAFDPREKVKMTMKNVPLAFPPTATVMMDGSLVAEGCAIVPITSRAKVRKQDGLAVTLDGKKLLVHGASMSRTAKGRVLRLTTEPHACDKGGQGSDVAIEMTVGDAADEATEVRVSGYSIPRPWLLKGEAAKVTATFGESTDPLMQEVVVGGAVRKGKHTLAVEGTVQAELCP